MSTRLHDDIGKRDVIWALVLAVVIALMAWWAAEQQRQRMDAEAAGTVEYDYDNVVSDPCAPPKRAFYTKK